MRCFALLRSTVRTVWLLSTLAVPGIPCISANAQTQPPIFPIPTQVPLPTGATPLFVGDFNGDGIPDLAYNSSSPSGTVGIILGFAGSSPTTVTTNVCWGAVFADVNNDKKLDAVSSCNGYITVQLGNGDGTFQAPAYYAVNTGTPVLVDLNGDGYLDIAAMQLGSPSPTPLAVAVLLNNGSTGPGVFGSTKQYALPKAASGMIAGYFSSLFAGDFNGDGKQDLLTTLPYSGTIDNPSPYTTATDVDIFSGNGDGTLRQATVQPGPALTSFTVGDFNGDGVTDFAELLTSASNTVYTSVQILLGATSGTFTQGASLPIAATAGGGPMAAVSLSDHGPLDLVVTTSVLNVFQGDGKGNFTSTGSYALTPFPLLFADVNGDGNQDLLAQGGTNGLYIFPGNGEGTFQAMPGAPFSGQTADVNNDGIADILFFPPQIANLGPGNFFATALGRGDGSYSILDQTTTLPSANGYLLMTGDFNGDGKLDTLAIQPGSNPNALSCVVPDAQLASYLGSGDGRFHAVGTSLALGVSDAGVGITGDFNSDGKLDLILPYCKGLLFLAGNGDGTFAAPVNLPVSVVASASLIVGDLNNDKKLDFIWGNAVFLGNGDGTFKQIPLNPAGTVIALADLNGDGILDAVYSPGTSIYAGNGDGTFQTTPFYTVPVSCNANACTEVGSFALGDVNGDGNPDLIFVESGSVPLSPSLVLYLGDGHGNFTQDPNYYFLGTLSGQTFMTMPVRLNNQAPPLASDNRLDLSLAVDLNGAGVPYTVSLLNQTNPTPVKPPLITSTTALQASPATAAPNASITLTASVFGTNPTGSVSFAANGNSLGTETLANGIATLQTSFANAGSYTVTATYSGDSNTASTSATTAVTISPAASSTTLQAPSGGNVNGQITLKATVSGDSPTGSVSFSTGSTGLGMATLTSGVATLQTSFAAAGSYPVTATYKGDQNNIASTSSAATVVIAAPDFTISAAPASGTITPGQTATFTFTVSPVGGYAGTVSFSCGTLPGQAACSFSPASVTPSGGSPASTTMTITTATSSAMLNPERRSSPWFPTGGLALAGVIGLAFAPKRIWRLNQQLRWLCWALLLASLSLLASGCGGGGNNSTSNPGTPAGSYTVSVTASSSAGGPQHAMSITLIVQ